MKYTRQVVKEILRYRPPAPMVPQMAQKPFKLTEDYTAPAGTMIVPSVWSACMQVSGAGVMPINHPGGSIDRRVHHGSHHDPFALPASRLCAERSPRHILSTVS